MKWKRPYTAIFAEVNNVKSGPSVPAISTAPREAHLTQTEVSYTQAAHRQGTGTQLVTHGGGEGGVVSDTSESTGTSDPTRPSVNVTSHSGVSKTMKASGQGGTSQPASLKTVGQPASLKTAGQPVGQPASLKTAGQPASSKTAGQGSGQPSSLRTVRVTGPGTHQPATPSSTIKAKEHGLNQPENSHSVELGTVTRQSAREDSGTAKVAMNGVHGTSSPGGLRPLKVAGDGVQETGSPAQSHGNGGLSSTSGDSKTLGSDEEEVSSVSSTVGMSQTVEKGRIDDKGASRGWRSQEVAPPMLSNVGGSLKVEEGGNGASRGLRSEEVSPLSSTVRASLRVGEGGGSPSASMVSVTDMSASLRSVEEDLEGELSEDITTTPNNGGEDVDDDDDDTMFEDSGKS